VSVNGAVVFPVVIGLMPQKIPADTTDTTVICWAVPERKNPRSLVLSRVSVLCRTLPEYSLVLGPE
jgi:hypothetical protein